VRISKDANEKLTKAGLAKKAMNRTFLLAGIQKLTSKSRPISERRLIQKMDYCAAHGFGQEYARIEDHH